MRCLISISCSENGRPKYVISPLSGCTRFSMDLMVVVFPAPFRPMKPVIFPASSENDTWSSRNAG